VLGISIYITGWARLQLFLVDLIAQKTCLSDPLMSFAYGSISSKKFFSQKLIWSTQKRFNLGAIMKYQILKCLTFLCMTICGMATMWVMEHGPHMLAFTAFLVGGVGGVGGLLFDTVAEKCLLEKDSGNDIPGVTPAGYRPDCAHTDIKSGIRGDTCVDCGSNVTNEVTND
jgi:hypothetical protein